MKKAATKVVGFGWKNIILINMNANELKLGNIVKRAIGWSDNERLHPVLFSNEPYIIDSINHLDCDLCDYPSEKNSITATLEDLQPITLTEEWLRRFAKRKEVIFFILDDRLSISIENILYINGQYWGKLLHVHQLQNLYFALNGEELTLIP